MGHCPLAADRIHEQQAATDSQTSVSVGHTASGIGAAFDMPHLTGGSPTSTSQRHNLVAEYALDAGVTADQWSGAAGGRERLVSSVLEDVLAVLPCGSLAGPGVEVRLEVHQERQPGADVTRPRLSGIDGVGDIPGARRRGNGHFGRDDDLLRAHVKRALVDHPVDAVDGLDRLDDAGDVLRTCRLPSSRDFISTARKIATATSSTPIRVVPITSKMGLPVRA